MKVPNFIRRWIRRQAVEAVAEALEKNQAPLAQEIGRHVLREMTAIEERVANLRKNLLR